MNDGKRACVAAIAFVAINHRSISGVFDQTRGRHVPLGIRCRNNLFNVYDNNRGGYIGGYLPMVFDYLSGYHIQIKINGRSFSGYDFETATYYNGRISGQTITIFDYGQGQYYNYGV